MLTLLCVPALADASNQAPTGITLSSSSVNQSGGVDAVVGTLSTIDPDSNNTHTYSLEGAPGATDNSRFNISGEQLRANNASTMPAGNYSVNIRTTDSGGLIFDQSFTLTVIDDIPPVVTSVTVPAARTYTLGETLSFTINANETLTTSGGTPRLQLDIGGVTRYATYQSGSGTSSLFFQYDVQAGDNDGDGIAVNSLELNGGSIRDDAGNDLVLTLNGVGDTSGVLVDALPPSINSVSVPPYDIYTIGNALDFTINASEPVTVNTTGGTPRLQLDIGGTTRYATYLSGSGTSALVFRYVVQAGDNDIDGIDVAILELDGGTIRDGAGNNLILTLNSVTDTSGVLVDTQPPSVSAIADQAVMVGQSTGPLAFTVGDNLTAASSLSVNRASTNTTAVALTDVVLGGSGANRTVTVTGTAEGSSTISIVVVDAGGNSTTTTFLVTVSPFNQAPTGIVLDNNTVNQSTGVNSVVGGLSTIDPDLNDSHTYSLVAGDGDTDNSAFNISILRFLTANDSSTMPAGDYSVRIRTTDQGGLTFEQIFVVTVIDNITPVVTSVSGPAFGTYSIGNTLDFTVNATRPLIVVTTGGMPRLSLDIGGLTRSATYLSGSGSTSLVFRYVIQAGDNDLDGIGVNSLELNGGTIQDGDGNNLNPALNGVTDTSGVLVDTLPPTVSAIADQIVAVGESTGPLAFTVGDNLTDAVSLSVNQASTNTTAVALTDVVLSGTGANRTVTVTGTAEGSSIISIVVTDAMGNSSTSDFMVTVTVIDDVAPVVESTPVPPADTADQSVPSAPVSVPSLQAIGVTLLGVLMLLIALLRMRHHARLVS